MSFNIGRKIWGERKIMRRSLVVLAVVTCIGELSYWAAVFFGVFPVEPLVPGYVEWFMAFPVADMWIAACAGMSVVFINKNEALSAIFMAATGSALVFLGLYAFAYGYNTGLLFNLTDAELVEIAIKIYCLSVGGFFLFGGYRCVSGDTQSRQNLKISNRQQ
jgi:hypothetical protein